MVIVLMGNSWPPATIVFMWKAGRINVELFLAESVAVEKHIKRQIAILFHGIEKMPLKGSAYYLH